MTHENQLAATKLWFEKAFPTPTQKNMDVQLGVHIEEFAEMMDSIGLDKIAADLQKLAMSFKTGQMTLEGRVIDRKELLDSLNDQIVTAVGIGHNLRLNILGGMAEVNRSNWSKFVDGNPVFDENGKIKKGPNYSKPNLDGMY